MGNHRITCHDIANSLNKMSEKRDYMRKTNFIQPKNSEVITQDLIPNASSYEIYINRNAPTFSRNRQVMTTVMTDHKKCSVHIGQKSQADSYATEFKTNFGPKSALNRGYANNNLK